MCGIVGFNWPDKKLMGRALKKISHRGPDGQGQFYDKEVSLGHRRLSIIDLSKEGKQPMTNEKGDLQIVFNGEIYNFEEIKSNLKNKHKFKSLTDTEVLLHLYEEDGTEMLSKLIGMFSFCIYDLRKNILFIARDRVGIKPLYYYFKNGKIFFSSEIKAILEMDSYKKEVNQDVLSSFLYFRANTEEDTFFKGIKKLLPGNFIIFNLKNKKMLIKNYWNVSFTKKDKVLNPENKLESLLLDSIKLRLKSDVPYGAYLSGGIDSSLVVAMMSQVSKQRVKTFSVGFDVENFSELKEANSNAEFLKTDHHQLTIRKDAIKKLPEIIYQNDEPAADPTIIPTYFLSEYAKKHCTVILTGEGADELFGGYPHYLFMKYAMAMNILPDFLRKSGLPLARLAPDSFLDRIFRFSSSLGEKGFERLDDLISSKTPEEKYISLASVFNKKEQEILLNKKVNLPVKFSQNDLLGQMFNFEFKNQMVEDLLMKLDKNTMAFGVEGRVPFLDHRVVEFAASLENSEKLDPFGNNKKILRSLAQKFLPDEIAKRKKKHFFVPINDWLEEDLNSIKNKFLSEEFIKRQGIFNYNYIIELEKERFRSPLYYKRQLWSLLTFQIWYLMYIKNEKISL